METITYYRIYNDLLNLNYIGKTTDFDDRIKHHKNNCYNPNGDSYNLKLYTTIRANGGWSNFKNMIINSIIFNDDEDGIEIRKMEQKFIELYNGNLNSNRAYLSIDDLKKYQQEYRELNKKKMKEYYEKNKEKNKEKNREQNKKNCKRYSDLNKEKNKEKLKQYYKLNKEKYQEKYSCLLCRGNYTTKGISTHKKTTKHKNKLNNIS